LFYRVHCFALEEASLLLAVAYVDVNADGGLMQFIDVFTAAWRARRRQQFSWSFSDATELSQ
jgi:hypothetical protein